MFNSGRRQRQRLIEHELLPHMDSLFRYALHLTRSRERAEELTQDTFTKAVENFEKFQPGTNGKAWLFRIMVNHHINLAKKKRPEVTYLDTVEPTNLEAGLGELMVRTHGDPEDTLVSKLAMSQIQEAIEALPPDFRSVLILADLEEFSYKEISEMLDCPLGTVMSRLHRGRRILRVKLLDLGRQMGLVEEAEEEVVEDMEFGEVMASLSEYRRKRGSAQAGTGSR